MTKRNDCVVRFTLNLAENREIGLNEIVWKAGPGIQKAGNLEVSLVRCRHFRISLEAIIIALGSCSLRDYRHTTNRAHARLWGVQQCGTRPRSYLHLDRHGCNGLHCHELRPHGPRLSQCRFRIHLCRPRIAPGARLCNGLEYDHGLHTQSLDQHNLGSQSYVRSFKRYPISDSLSRLALASIFCHIVYSAQSPRYQIVCSPQSTIVRDHGCGPHSLFLVCNPLYFPFEPISRVIFLASIFQTLRPSRSIGYFTAPQWRYSHTSDSMEYRLCPRKSKTQKRNIFLATVLVCVVTGFLAAAEVYSAQLLSLQYIFPAAEVENAFAHVAAIAGGVMLTRAISLTLLVATIGAGMGSQLGAARLLYGMGRSNAIPKRFFGAIHPKTRIPANNVVFVGVIALIGAFLISYGDGAELLNFGALIAFMGVNLASLTHYYVRGRDRTMGQLIPPVLGFSICLFIWIHLSNLALIAGSIWMVAGIAYGAIKTRGFQSNLVDFEIPPEGN